MVFLKQISHPGSTLVNVPFRAIATAVGFPDLVVPKTVLKVLRNLNQGIFVFPVMSTAILYTGRYGFSDYSVQLATNGYENFNRVRLRSFAVFGCVIGFFLGTLYTRFYPLLKLKYGISALSILFIDLCIETPFAYYPLFYITQETVMCNSNYPTWNIVKQAIYRYKNNFIDDNLRIMKFWSPVLAVNLFFVPFHLRGVYMAMTGIFWSAILSCNNGKYKDNIS